MATRTTENIRISLDIELQHPKDAKAMIDLADAIEDVVGDLRSVKRVSWTETIAQEADFDYGDWNRLMEERRAAKGGE